MLNLEQLERERLGKIELKWQLCIARERLKQPEYAEAAALVIDEIERILNDGKTKAEM